ncbi:hypothetical protein D1872_324540 [compost metagenome]
MLLIAPLAVVSAVESMLSIEAMVASISMEAMVPPTASRISLIELRSSWCSSSFCSRKSRQVSDRNSGSL